PLRHLRVKQIERRGLTRHALVPREREIAPVPRGPLTIIQIEVVNFLRDRDPDSRMLLDKVEQRAGAALLRSDNEEVRHLPQRAGHTSAHGRETLQGRLQSSIHCGWPSWLVTWRSAITLPPRATAADCISRKKTGTRARAPRFREAHIEQGPPLE